MTLGWGLIGPGRRGDSCILPAIKQSQSSQLIGVCHYDKEKADFFARRYEAKRSYTTMEEMLADPEVQVVNVSTPDPLHKEQVIKAAQAGRHVRCEFPLALTVEDCKDMISVCEKAKVKLAGGFPWAHNPAHVEMRKRIAEGYLGEINYVEGQYNFPWGGGAKMQTQSNWKLPPREPVTHNQAWKRDPSFPRYNSVIHQTFVIYMLRFLLGREVEELTAIADPEGEKKSVACLRFEGDIVGTALGSFSIPYGTRGLTIYGTEGRITGEDTFSWDSTGELRILKCRCKETPEDRNKSSEGGRGESHLQFEGEKMTETIEYCGANMYVDAIEAFNKNILEDTEVIPSGIDGLRDRQITDAILESISTGKAVKIRR